MEPVVDRCAGIDIGKITLKATVRVQGGPRRKTRREVRGFETTTAGLLKLRDWLVDEQAFVDVGANVGVFCWLVHAANPRLRLVAFEPTPSVARWARTNAALNFAVHRCPGNRSGRQARHSALLLVKHDRRVQFAEQGFRGVEESIEVDVSTLDDYLATQRVIPALGRSTPSPPS